jgi:hypothetical protein
VEARGAGREEEAVEEDAEEGVRMAYPPPVGRYRTKESKIRFKLPRSEARARRRSHWAIRWEEEPQKSQVRGREAMRAQIDI